MKRVFVLGILAVSLFACNSEDKSGGEKKAATAALSADDEKALTLIGQSGCAPTCHAIDKKVIGPSYKDVAAKYEATEENIDKLADKVINGGQGVWGSVPMNPNPSLSKEDAKLVVRYILSLKNK
ncbi:MAG: cytochrome c class I [Chitinophagaceae bacterium]